MKRQLLIILSVSVLGLGATNMKRIARIPSGPYAAAYGRMVCCDSDHDSLPEMIFSTGGTVNPPDPLRVEVWEHRSWNRLSLVYADTGNIDQQPLPGITTGNAIPFAAGDIDGDGLTDIVCIAVGYDSTKSGAAFDVLMTVESPDSFSYPCSLSWYYRFSNLFVIPIPIFYPPDLDEDGHREILSLTPDTSIATGIWENVDDDSNELVWHDTVYGYRFTFGDFDLDGRMNFATGDLGSSGWVEVWECTGDNQYERAYRDTVFQPNGADVFTTNDIDGDGKPEFYVAYENVPRGKIYLYMWEADQAGTDIYHRALVDSVSFSGTDWGRISECGDIDGDGIDECIWTTPAQIRVYKADGDDNLQEVWRWYSDHGSMQSLVSTVYDVNSDGYNELITAGNGKTSVFEVDAVDLLAPNRGGYQPGDTVSIRWATHSPPRCDSLSLFLRRDSMWNLDTIAHGLPATDTLYQWVVPASVPDTGRIVVIAYGGLPPLSSDENGGCTQSQSAWQFDISDSVINFIGGGVADGTRSMPTQWSLSVSPNPARGAFTVTYDVPGKWGQSQPLRGQTEVQSPFSTVSVFALGIYDVGGRMVRSLTDGEVPRGRYEVKIPSGLLPAGVYFCTMNTGVKRISRKVVISR